MGVDTAIAPDFEMAAAAANIPARAPCSFARGAAAMSMAEGPMDIEAFETATIGADFETMLPRLSWAGTGTKGRPSFAIVGAKEGTDFDTDELIDS